MPAVTNFDYLGWMAKFNRQIDDIEEFKTRLGHFTATHNWIQEHNASGANWKAGHNQFSDWSQAEYEAILGRKGDREQARPSAMFPESTSEFINWLEKGAVTDVKDQGKCGSCWAFSTTGSLEGAHYVETGELVSFSEQQLIDCNNRVHSYRNMGCQGGLQSDAYQYYMDGNNPALESDYPYWSGGTGVKQVCNFSESIASLVAVQTFV